MFLYNPGMLAIFKSDKGGWHSEETRRGLGESIFALHISKWMLQQLRKRVARLELSEIFPLTVNEAFELPERRMLRGN